MDQPAAAPTHDVLEDALARLVVAQRELEAVARALGAVTGELPPRPGKEVAAVAARSWEALDEAGYAAHVLRGVLRALG